ncbi:MAG: YHS domain-containing (seleno)protein [Rubrivivax sp.]|nr:YHS domain-containing (seleno)protein [Rubrivivax sp.]
MPSMRALLALFASALFAFLPAHAQTTAEPGVALRGMDVVSYFKSGGPVPGLPEFRHDFDGARYLFSSAQHKASFVAEPDRYLPQFSGLCTTGISLGKEFKGDPNTWRVVDGKLYLYYSAPVRAKGDADPATIAIAHQKWAERK